MTYEEYQSLTESDRMLVRLQEMQGIWQASGYEPVEEPQTESTGTEETSSHAREENARVRDPKLETLVERAFGVKAQVFITEKNGQAKGAYKYVKRSLRSSRSGKYHAGPSGTPKKRA